MELTTEQKLGLLTQRVERIEDHQEMVSKSVVKLNQGATEDLQIVAMTLHNKGYFESIDDVIHFYEKPWKWKEEYDLILSEKENEKQ